MCKSERETNYHIGVECPFTQTVWLMIEDNLKLNNLWNGDFVTTCFKNWCLNMEVANCKPLAIIVIWFIWKAKNLSYFEDLTLSPAQVSSFSLGMMKNIPQNQSVLSIRNILVEVIDKTYPWGFFDGSAAGDPVVCGAGGMLLLSDVHYFSFKAGLGLGTNNFVELCALKLLLILARRHSVDKIQIFGDSQLVINWASRKYRLFNIELAMILRDVNSIADGFETVSFRHIYQECNTVADALAKAGGGILEGSWPILEHRPDTEVETFQVF